MNEIAILLGVSLILGAAIIPLIHHFRQGIGKSAPCLEYGLESLEPRIAPAALAAKFNGGLLIHHRRCGNRHRERRRCQRIH